MTEKKAGQEGEAFSREPQITINGKTLTEAQAMTLRVAVSSFAMGLTDPTEGAALGPIGDGYAARLRELERMLVANS